MQTRSLESCHRRWKIDSRPTCYVEKDISRNVKGDGCLMGVFCSVYAMTSLRLQLTSVSQTLGVTEKMFLFLYVIMKKVLLVCSHYGAE